MQSRGSFSTQFTQQTKSGICALEFVEVIHNQDEITPQMFL
jgi:hypothetical protein